MISYAAGKYLCAIDLNFPNLIRASLSISSFVGDESELLKIIANYGPVTAAVNAESWQNYMGGVIQTECENDIEKTNHAVEIIGYDRGGAVPHYIVQNSWGEDFGEKGYIRLAMGSNACGIANQISFGRLLMKY